MICVYYRVSTISQTMDMQRDIVLRATSENHPNQVVEVFQDEYMTGKDFDRDGLKKLLEYCKANPGSMIYVYKIDRLGRTVSDLLNVMNTISQKYKCTIISVSDHITIDMNSVMGRALATLIALFADIEHTYIIERLQDGRRASTKKQGRKPVMVDMGTVLHYVNNKHLTLAETSRMMGLKQSTLWKKVNEAGYHLTDRKVVKKVEQHV